MAGDTVITDAAVPGSWIPSASEKQTPLQELLTRCRQALPAQGTGTPGFQTRSNRLALQGEE